LSVKVVPTARRLEMPLPEVCTVIEEMMKKHKGGMCQQGKGVGNKMHKAFPLPGESSHWRYKFPLSVKVVPTARRLEMPLPEVNLAIYTYSISGDLYVREHGRMILESVEHGSLIWPTIEENGVIKTKKYVELSAAKKIQADCDMKATNIILQGLTSDIYSLVNHHRVAKGLWERIQLLMQVNTKFLNSLPPEWSKFVTRVKLVKDLHTSNFDQLHAYLQQHELYESQHKQPKNAAWYKEKAMLAEAQEAKQILDEKQLLFLADPGVPDAVLRANISNYSSDVISKVPHSESYLNNMENQSVLAMQDFEQPPAVDFTDNEIHSDSNIIPLTKDFGKRFTPQQELSAEQAFRLHMSDPTSKPSDALPVKIKALKELPKLSLVNESLKKLKFHLAKFDNVVKIKTTPSALTEGKEIVDIAAQKPSANVIVPEMFKIDLEPLVVRDLETTKTTQALEIDSLKRIVKKLERRWRSRTHGLKRLYKIGLSARVESSEDEGLGEEDASKQRKIADIDANEDIYLVNVQNDEDIFGVNGLDGDEAKINDDYELALRLQAEEQEELTDAEKAKLFMQFLKKMRKFFAAKRAEEKRNIPPTRAQQRKLSWWKRVQRKKVEDDKESKELKKCLEIIPDDEDDVTIDATTLSSNKMLKIFDREDMDVLWKLVKARFKKMVNYSQWEVIENGNAPPITKVVEGVETTIAPATAEEKVQRRLKLKASDVATDKPKNKLEIVGNKMHKAFPLLGESSHWQYKFPLPVEGVPTARRMEIPLPGVCTAMMKKLPVKENWQLH
nr:hypothetical protein [Tanacetum cinerariifolium]